MPPVEPPASRWPASSFAGPPRYGEVVAVGGDLQPGTVLAAYRAGAFPMGLGPGGTGPLGWWSPDPRGVLLPGGLRVTRSLRTSVRRFEVTFDEDFEGVVQGCADPSRSGRWITPRIAHAYGALHRLGWAHSVEVRLGGRLVGGLYGLQFGGLFAGESMFHRERDASKVALVALMELLGGGGTTRGGHGGDAEGWFTDVQWLTPHLASLGAIEIPRADYLARLRVALALPSPWGESGCGGPAQAGGGGD